MAVNHDRGAVDGLQGMSQGQEPLIQLEKPGAGARENPERRARENHPS